MNPIVKRLRTPLVTHHQVNRDHEPYETVAKTHAIEPIKLEAAREIERLEAIPQPAEVLVIRLILGNLCFVALGLFQERVCYRALRQKRRLVDRRRTQGMYGRRPVSRVGL